MLTGGAAAKVFPRQHNAGTAKCGLVQHEIRVGDLAFCIAVTPVVKQVAAKTGARHHLQKLLRDNRIGIDVCRIHRHHDAGMLGKFLRHTASLNQFADISKMACYRRSRSHRRAQQMRAAAAALTTFKVAVAGGCATLTGIQTVVIHCQTH